jgi:hypothetical protein
VKLVHFEVKRRKNYRIPGSKTLTFFQIRFIARKNVGSQHEAFGDLFVQIVQRAAGMSSRSGEDQFER